MKRLAFLRGALAGGVCALALATAAHAQAPRPFNLLAGDLSVTLEAYIRQSGLNSSTSPAMFAAVAARGSPPRNSAPSS